MLSFRLFHRIRAAVVVVIFMLAMLLSSCRTTRIIEQHNTVTDTVSVRFADTTRIVSCFDTVYVTNREVITEHIVEHFDPTTGLITLRDIDRLVQRSADSIASHRLDSLLRSLHFEGSKSHAGDSGQSIEEVPPSQSWFSRLLNKLSSVIIVTVVTLLSIFCVKVYNHK